MKTRILLLISLLGPFTLELNAATESITLTLPPGFCLLANHLNHGDNSLSTLFPVAPIESQVLKFANNNYVMDIFDGNTWLNDAGDPSRTTISPGQGFFFFNPGSQNFQVTFTGDIPQGPQMICFPPGFSLVGSPGPRPLFLNSSNDLPRVL